MPDPAPGVAPNRRRSIVKAAALMGGGAVLAVGLGVLLTLADLRFDAGRLIHAATGSEALAEACRGSLVRGLAERGFEPDEVEFGPGPTVGPPWTSQRSFGDSFTFQDGAERVRIDGVVACVVSGGHVSVEFRVGSNPHRDA